MISKEAIEFLYALSEVTGFRLMNGEELQKIMKLRQLGYHSLAYTRYNKKTKRFAPEHSYIDDLRIITNEVR